MGVRLSLILRIHEGSFTILVCRCKEPVLDALLFLSSGWTSISVSRLFIIHAIITQAILIRYMVCKIFSHSIYSIITLLFPLWSETLFHLIQSYHSVFVPLYHPIPLSSYLRYKLKLTTLCMPVLGSMHLDLAFSLSWLQILDVQEIIMFDYYYIFITAWGQRSFHIHERK